MPTEPIAELSSISSALNDLSKRLGDLADSLSAKGNNDIAFELFEVERSLSTGLRRLGRLVNR